eukprot:CAMPEP_0197827604 /NCGR_PEP_ID=MMETSP1437-20131217/4351_1 /TAXON_ID=49252 ORGANISM="Eucampia antarctica, Strain CCMP1452" /NCGR_SAMPLE_ID=MMETSP1437 /ASSEMBLY_ACC=CAM_ASM_001096 /LENGTH=85 /DNA_ID=CAMNT_0043428517 /DNA_START=199 /DNA_END=453 /DNA_ORIENTATION=+
MVADIDKLDNYFGRQNTSSDEVRNHFVNTMFNDPSTLRDLSRRGVGNDCVPSPFENIASEEDVDDADISRNDDGSINVCDLGMKE